jgi:hypothetical protein
MLSKNIIIRSSHRTFKSKAYSSHHSHLQQQTSNNLLVRMDTIQSNSLICYGRTIFSIRSPKGIASCFSRNWLSGHSLIATNSSSRCKASSVLTTCRKTPLSLECTKSNAKKLYTSNWISPSLLCQNFSRRNVLKHYNKLKLNCQCTYIHQLL